MILSAQTIRRREIVSPFNERTVAHGMTYGLGPSGYDIRIAETVTLEPRSYTLASAIEHLTMPADVMGTVADKSTWARQFLTVQHTIIEAGWAGWLTLELTNHSDHTIVLKAGMPIAQVVFMQLDAPTERPYDGKYQHQKPGPQPAIQQELPGVSDGPLFQPRKVLHAVRQENDEYACMCGARWDVVDGEGHP